MSAPASDLQHAGRLKVGGVQLAYRVDGPAPDAPVVVLLHSLGTDLRMWEAQAAPLARRFRVVRYDCRGHGESDVAAGPRTVERLGRDVLALLDHLEIQRAPLCGISLGGLTTLWLAVHHPERVDRAVLANTGARIGSHESWDARIRAVQQGGMSAVRDAVLARWLGEEFRLAHPDVARALGEMLDHTPVPGYFAACRALRDADLRADARTVRAPTLIIAGERDESTPPALSEALHAAIPESVLVPSLNVVLGAPSLSALFTTPPTPLANEPRVLLRYVMAFDMDRDAPRIFDRAGAFTESSWDLVGAQRTDLSAFRRRGGKLIVPHGVSDPVFSAHDTMRWWDQVNAASGGGAAEFARVFPVPGMAHCGGGPATDQYDCLTSIVDWVERGTAPDRIIARAGASTPWSGRTRPLCPYPLVARYGGSGDVEAAASFACRP